MHSQLRKRIRILSRDPNSRQRRFKGKRPVKVATGSSKSKRGGKKRKRNIAAEDESEESAGEVEDESDDEDEWQGDKMNTDGDTNTGTKAQGAITEGVRRSARRRASRYAWEPRSEATEGSVTEIEADDVTASVQVDADGGDNDGENDNDDARIQCHAWRARVPGKRKRDDAEDAE